MGKLYLVTGDYIENAVGMDAIVDAQNKYMGVGGNICGLILNAAGRKELLEYCKNNYSENMYPSEVRITPGFNLNMDIIHVLAPIFSEEKEPYAIMHQTYLNLINEIKKQGYKKVMICSLGTGSHGYNPKLIANDVINILNTFAKENDVELYFNNMYPAYKDVFLEEYLKINNIDISNLKNMSNSEIRSFIEDNSLNDIYITEKYNNFVEGKEIRDLCLSEKLIYLEYAIKNNLNVIKDIIEKL
jgi:O-acetyl-ADP-ribose deacetylase (regulator of RNase III)